MNEEPYLTDGFLEIILVYFPHHHKANNARIYLPATAIDSKSGTGFARPRERPGMNRSVPLYPGFKKKGVIGISLICPGSPPSSLERRKPAWVSRLSSGRAQDFSPTREKI